MGDNIKQRLKLPNMKDKIPAGKQETIAASRLARLRDKATNQLPKDKIQRQRKISIVGKLMPGNVEQQFMAHRTNISRVEVGARTVTSTLHMRLGKPDSVVSIRDVHGEHDDHVMERKTALIQKAHTRKRIGKLPRISPKAQFKRIVRLVINQQLHKTEAGSQGSQRRGKGKEQGFFDKNLFKANQNRGLTSVEKRVLQKAPEDRTDEDLSILKGVVDRLKCFDKYTRVVKRDLSRVIFYMTLNSGRYIIKQGHDGFSFYFIVSGKVQVRIGEVDKVTGEKKEHAVAEMKEGTSFGELALMHNIKRTASIVCIANGSVFLRVERHDFERVLRMSTEKEWTDRLNVLKWQPKFNDFKEKEKEDLNQHCKMQEYAPGSLIIGNTNTVQDTMYFIASGTCMIIRELTIVKEKMKYGEEKLHLLEDMSAATKLMFPHADLSRRRGAASRFLKPDKQLWSVGDVGKGFYFGVGEDLSHTFVVAKDKVEILEVRRIKFIKHGRWKLVERMKEEFDKALPTNKQLFMKYMEESRWDQYKQKLVSDVVTKRHVPNNTEWTDVPMALKTNSIRAGSLQSALHIKF